MASIASVSKDKEQSPTISISSKDQQLDKINAETTVPRQKKVVTGRVANRVVTLAFLCGVTVAILLVDFAAFGQQGSVPDFPRILQLLQVFSEGGIAFEIVVMIICAIGATVITRKKNDNVVWEKVKTTSKDQRVAKVACAGSQESSRNSGGDHRRQSATVKFNQTIDIAARSGDVRKVVALLTEFQASGEILEAVTFNYAIRACARAGDLSTAESLMQKMKACDVTPTLCTYNTMLDVCAKVDRPGECEAWIEHMLKSNVKANVISYATVIYSHARVGNISAAEAWLRRMVDAGVYPDAVVYNSVIHACSVKGDVESAERWLKEMECARVKMSVASYTAVIDACSKSSDLGRAETWILRMLENNVPPNVMTFSAVIDACAKTGNLPRAEYWMERMRTHGIKPNAHSFSAVINACAKMASTEGAQAAERWLERSKEAGCVGDVVIYSTVIDACGKAGDAERALRIFNNMRSEGLTPHIVAYAALARPYAYRGDWVKVENIAQTMAADQVENNEYFLYAQILAYGVARPKQPERAEECFRQAIASGMKANDHVAGALCRALGRGRCQAVLTDMFGDNQVPPLAARRGGEGRKPRHRIGGGADSLSVISTCQSVVGSLS